MKQWAALRGWSFDDSGIRVIGVMLVIGAVMYALGTGMARWLLMPRGWPVLIVAAILFYWGMETAVHRAVPLIRYTALSRDETAALVKVACQELGVEYRREDVSDKAIFALGDSTFKVAVQSFAYTAYRESPPKIIQAKRPLITAVVLRPIAPQNRRVARAFVEVFEPILEATEGASES